MTKPIVAREHAHTEQRFSLDYARAWGEPTGQVDFRSSAADFVVDEELGLVLSGDGDHVYLQIRKTEQNTHWVAEQLAQFYQIDGSELGYCGLKDRRAVATQWFSVRLPEAQTELSPVAQLLPGTELWPGCELLQITRHRRKLRRGMHEANSFKICLRNFSGEPGLAEQRLNIIAELGVPNYFGEQRFGREGGNLRAAEQILSQSISRKGRDRKWGIYVSAARSHLFNTVLSARVGDGSWRKPVDGEISPSGPLWGRGRSGIGKRLGALEDDVLAGHTLWCHGLEHCGFEQQRRPLVLIPKRLSWQWQHRQLDIQFTLPPGTYATSILRELALTNVPLSRPVL